MKYAVSALIAVFVAVIIFDVINTRTIKPTTVGMSSSEVVESYYNALDGLDYRMMEACVAPESGSGITEDDIAMVRNLFVYTGVRRSCPHVTWSEIVSAQDWLEDRKPPVDAFVFGITNMRIKEAIVQDESGITDSSGYIVDYRIWIAWEYSDTEIGTLEETTESMVYYNSDFVTLERIEDRWRITEIRREQQPA
jgi:hypothetical protein